MPPSRSSGTGISEPPAPGFTCCFCFPGLRSLCRLLPQGKFFLLRKSWAGGRGRRAHAGRSLGLAAGRRVAAQGAGLGTAWQPTGMWVALMLLPARQLGAGDFAVGPLVSPEKLLLRAGAACTQPAGMCNGFNQSWLCAGKVGMVQPLPLAGLSLRGEKALCFWGKTWQSTGGAGWHENGWSAGKWNGTRGSGGHGCAGATSPSPLLLI